MPYYCLNPPIRGSIVKGKLRENPKISYQSPYKGFNSRASIWQVQCTVRINPPIRGSIAVLRAGGALRRNRINPPIRGSIEQDNALFENYNHKR